MQPTRKDILMAAPRRMDLEEVRLSETSRSAWQLLQFPVCEVLELPDSQRAGAGAEDRVQFGKMKDVWLDRGDGCATV